MDENTAEKTATRESNGGTLLSGNPGNKGGGRPKDEWKAALREMASADETLAHVRAVLAEGPTNPFFSRALDYATDHGYGKAESKVDMTSNGETVSGVVIVQVPDNGRDST